METIETLSLFGQSCFRSPSKITVTQRIQAWFRINEGCYTRWEGAGSLAVDAKKSGLVEFEARLKSQRKSPALV